MCIRDRLHAVRVELLVRDVMPNIFTPSDLEPFLYWLRFEWGTNGNPHAHGLAYVSGNPYFEQVLRDEVHREALRARGRDDVDLYETWEQAEDKVASFFDEYIQEMHPAKDEDGFPLYDFILDKIQLPREDKPQTINLHQLLEEVFQDNEPDVSKLKEVLLALIDDGQSHSRHGFAAPRIGAHACARKGKRPNQERTEVYCRYLFPREMLKFETTTSATADAPPAKRGVIRTDPYRPDLRNLCLSRNDQLLNNFEEHMLLANLGNVDWRALINLWSVLDYLTKYATKPGKGSTNLNALFEDVLQTVYKYETEDGLSDLWRRSIMKFYSRILGDREYTLFEVMHYGLRLPSTLSSFGQPVSVSVSNWSSVQNVWTLRRAQANERATNLSKLELFSQRATLELPRAMKPEQLENLSFYAFWRLFDVRSQRLSQRTSEPIVVVNGTGWPSHAATTHPMHDHYAQKTLYAYMPCHKLTGIEYIDHVVLRDYAGSYRNALEAFVSRDNPWCPQWIRRNYLVKNQKDVERDVAPNQPPTTNETKEKSKTTSVTDLDTELPHAAEFNVKYDFPGEPDEDNKDSARPESHDNDSHWQFHNRPPWQQHSALGASLNNADTEKPAEPMHECINPPGIDWSVNLSLIHI